LPELTCALLLGCLMSVALYGYQVGKSNHTVYLLDALHRLDPKLLANDWFTTSTMQYHGLFALLTEWTLRHGVFYPVFLAGYALTVIGFQYACWRVVRAIGGSLASYLLAMMLYHLSAGGTGLGGFQFLQDGAFLPSNLANVAMLMGLAMLLEARIWPGAIWLGLAGMFHINHAVFAGPLYVVGVLAIPGWRRRWAAAVLGGLVCAALTLVDLGPAFLSLRSHDAGEHLPFQEYVQIFARLRHPHHYYPLAWPMAAIVAPIWTLMPASVVLWRASARIPVAARRVLFSTSALLLFATAVAWIFAGVFFVSERLVEMAVFRFSIYYIFFACALTAWGLLDSGLVTREIGTAISWAVGPLLVLGCMIAHTGVFGALARGFVSEHAPPLLLTAALALAASAVATFRATRLPSFLWTSSAAAVVALGAASVAFGWTGLNYIPEDDADYIALAHWARENTAQDAIFVVPPNEQSWRLESRRAIIINFKAIPQTTADMPEWKRRMQDVTGVRDLPSLAGTFTSTLAKLGQVYDARSAEDLAAVARKYHAQYIVTTDDYATLPHAAPDFGRWRMYEVK
jgi:hypothetical protein